MGREEAAKHMPDAPLFPTSYLAFVNALTDRKDFSASPTAERTVAYCLELANLRIDFDSMGDLLDCFWGYLDCIGSDNATVLVRRKFLVVYSEDNATLRVHGYRERIFQLTNHVLGLGIPEKDVQTIEKVSKKLQEGGQLDLLHCLESLTRRKPPTIRDALDRRNEFVHRLPRREWESLRSGAMLTDWIDIDWDTETFQSKDPHEVQLEADNLDRKFRQVCSFLESLREELDSFESDFCRCLYFTRMGSS